MRQSGRIQLRCISTGLRHFGRIPAKSGRNPNAQAHSRRWPGKCAGGPSHCPRRRDLSQPAGSLHQSLPCRWADRHALAPVLRKMTELTGQQWVVENRGGAGGNLGMEVLSKSDPDGYTLGLGGIAAHAISPSLYAKLPFNARTDFTFISTIWWLPNLLAVNLNVPANSVAELVELCRKNPGKYSYGSAGSGTTLHLSGELFKMLAKVDIQHVPYRGSAPATQDLLAGQIHMMFD